VVVAISIHGHSISEQKLKEFYSRLNTSRLSKGNSVSFNTTMRLLVGALLNRIVYDKDNFLYNLFNPSIADFVLSSYIDDIDYLDEILACLQTKESITNINSLYRSDGIDKTYASKLIEKQLVRISKTTNKYELDEFLLRLLNMASELIIPKNDLLNYITKLSEKILMNE